MTPSKTLAAGAMAFIAGIAAGSGALFSWGAILAIFLLLSPRIFDKLKHSTYTYIF